MPAAALLSFRLGGPDGVSVAAAQWAWALGRLGWSVRTVAGRGPVDVLFPGLAWPAEADPSPDEVAAAVAGCDVVIVENLCSLPLHPAASAAVAAARRGHPTVLHHYDLPWQRPRFAAIGWDPPTDPAWVHVVINDLSQRQMATRGIPSTVEPLRIDPGWSAAGRRASTRALLGVAGGERLLIQPTRAIARKGVADGLALAGAAGATYWLTGPAEEGYDAELAATLARAATRVLRGADEHGISMADAYAAADGVVLPSSWEGFGLPLLEAAVARRPLAVRRYPVATDLEAVHGFIWLAPDDPEALRAALDHPDPVALDRNESIVRDCFDVHDLPARLAPLLEGVR
ncbi:MAG: glycosyltransferase [Acidimicrobiales bacterium]